MTTKELFGLASVALCLLCYGPYFYSIIRGKTRPHTFSWIVWSIVNAIVFLSQWSDGAEAGAWVTGMTALFCLTVVGLSLRNGETTITRSDWVSFIAALAMIPLWSLTKDPLAAVLLGTAIDALGCYPTLRKSFVDPHSEPVFSWAVAGARSFISIFAIQHYSLVTVLYPVAMILTNGGGACVLLLRRRKLIAVA
jgi:hypothetical protein